MADFENAVQDAIAAQDIPGCVLTSTNGDGTFNYTKSFGKTSMTPSKAADLAPNTVMWVASCTKLMTSLSCMQLVERGLADLDAPIYKHIPELESFNVLTGFQDDGTPIEHKHKTPLTLRHLLTHTSGLTYDATHPKALAWLKHHKRLPGTSGKILERFNVPLMFEPGESWIYGPSTDYAGLFVERVTNKSLETYMRENIWNPLGIRDMTFHLSSRPDMAARLADMALRDPKTGKVRATGTRMPYTDGEAKEVADCFGGQGVFTTPEEYVKVLRAVLVCDEREVLLQRASVEEFFRPQLGDGSKAMLNAILQDDMTNNAMGGTSKDVQKDWGLGGLLIPSDLPDGKKAGTMIWGGAPNLIWWIDRATGLCGLYAGQVWPPGDAKCAVLDRKFEQGMYELYARSKTRPRL